MIAEESRASEVHSQECSSDANPQKSLFVIKNSGFGGLEVILLDWLGGVNYSKASVVVVCRADIYSDIFDRKGIPVRCVPLTISDGESFFTSLYNWWRLFSLVRPNRIILLEGGVGEFGLAAVLAAFRFARRNLFIYESLAPRPFVKGRRKLHLGFLPGLGLYRLKRIFEIWFRGHLASKTLVMSKGTKEKMVSYFRYPSAQTFVNHHGVDTQRFSPCLSERKSFRQANGIPENAIVIVSHGRLAPVKRVDRILKAFEASAAKRENLWLLLTAYGPLKEEVESVVASRDCFRHVKLVGFQKDTSHILKAGDLYVLASDNEGFGIALVEAMSTGLVCVATNTSGPDEILVNGQNGFLVEATDDALAKGLECALELNEEQRESMTQRARRTAIERFEIRGAIRNTLTAMGIEPA
jgi:glycosyltransferase involved in cell wall biosynthesis